MPIIIGGVYSLLSLVFVFFPGLCWIRNFNLILDKKLTPFWFIIKVIWICKHCQYLYLTFITENSTCGYIVTGKYLKEMLNYRLVHRRSFSSVKD